MGSFLLGRWSLLFSGMESSGPVDPVALEDFQSARSGGLGESRRVAGDLHCTLSGVVLRVVVHRRDGAFTAWRNWLREDPLIHPYKWLRPDMVPPAPFLQCNSHLTPGGSGVLADPGLMRNSEKPGFPIFVVLGKGRPALRTSFMRWMVGRLCYLRSLYLCLPCRSCMA